MKKYIAKRYILTAKAETAKAEIAKAKSYFRTRKFRTSPTKFGSRMFGSRWPKVISYLGPQKDKIKKWKLPNKTWDKRVKKGTRMNGTEEQADFVLKKEKQNMR